MTRDDVVVCMTCSATATQLIGFSAPMGLPGEETVDLHIAKAVVLPGRAGGHSFRSAVQLE
jgi:hypothetical protein